MSEAHIGPYEIGPASDTIGPFEVIDGQSIGPYTIGVGSVGPYEVIETSERITMGPYDTNLE